MEHTEEATPVVTLSDWAYVGNKRNLIKVRPPKGNDSLVRRLREGRTTEADQRFLESVKTPPPLATFDEVNRLWDLLAARYGDFPDSPEKRLAMAKRAVREIALHTSMPVGEIWGMTVGNAAETLAKVPIANEANGSVHQIEGDRLTPPNNEQIDRAVVDRKRVPWRQASKEMLAMYKGGDPFTSHLDMSKRIGCSPSTINKAITHTPNLKEWAARPACSATGMQSLDGIVVDNAPQQTAPDPSDMLDDEDVDLAMQYLLEQAKPIEKARINAMEPPERRELAQTAYRDPDKAEQLMRWRNRNRDST